MNDCRGLCIEYKRGTSLLLATTVCIPTVPLKCNNDEYVIMVHVCRMRVAESIMYWRLIVMFILNALHLCSVANICCIREPGVYMSALYPLCNVLGGYG